MDKINLIPIKQAHLEFARKLRNENKQYFYIDREISKSEMKRWFETRDKNTAFYIIYLDLLPVGTISVKNMSSYLELGNILIHEQDRKQGIFGQVLDEIYDIYGDIPIELEVRNDNTTALLAYQKLGFKPKGIRLRK